MSKERLEDARSLLNHLKGYGVYEKRNDVEVLGWLIEQAERAQKNAQDLEDMDRQLYSEQQQNKRYRATINAMQQILKDAIHSLDAGEKVQGLEYGVSMAEKALEGEV